MTRDAYAFSVGEYVRFPTEALDPRRPMEDWMVGVVEDIGPPTGMFGNYGVLIRWLNTRWQPGEPNPRWEDDLDVEPIPVVDLLVMAERGLIQKLA